MKSIDWKIESKERV